MLYALHAMNHNVNDVRVLVATTTTAALDNYNHENFWLVNISNHGSDSYKALVIC